MKMLKLFKYKEQARTMMDILEDHGISFEEKKMTPVEIWVEEENYDRAMELLKENSKYIECVLEKWYAVTTTPDEMTAEIIKSSLDAAGIPCLLKGLAIPFGEPVIMGQTGIVPMEILVPCSYYDEAKAHIEVAVNRNDDMEDNNEDGQYNEDEEEYRDEEEQEEKDS